jgi:uncharacterized membrane protein
MQIKFTPLQIKLSKRYIENLIQDEKNYTKEIKKRLNPSFLKRGLGLFSNIFKYFAIK